jgi:hypothetical protein
MRRRQFFLWTAVPLLTLLIAPLIRLQAQRQAAWRTGLSARRQEWQLALARNSASARVKNWIEGIPTSASMFAAIKSLQSPNAIQNQSPELPQAHLDTVDDSKTREFLKNFCADQNSSERRPRRD